MDFAADIDALAILSEAKARVLDEMPFTTFRALEAWRCVASAYDHVSRESRVACGLDRRADTFFPEEA